jgi:hypothetical protein
MVRVMPVSTFFIVIVTSEITAPDWSDTVPRIVPDVTWAEAAGNIKGEQRANDKKIEVSIGLAFISEPPFEPAFAICP